MYIVQNITWKENHELQLLDICWEKYWTLACQQIFLTWLLDGTTPIIATNHLDVGPKMVVTCRVIVTAAFDNFMAPSTAQHSLRPICLSSGHCPSDQW